MNTDNQRAISPSPSLNPHAKPFTPSPRSSTDCLLNYDLGNSTDDSPLNSLNSSRNVSASCSSGPISVPPHYPHSVHHLINSYMHQQMYFHFRYINRPINLSTNESTDSHIFPVKPPPGLFDDCTDQLSLPTIKHTEDNRKSLIVSTDVHHMNNKYNRYVVNGTDNKCITDYDAIKFVKECDNYDKDGILLNIFEKTIWTPIGKIGLHRDKEWAYFKEVTPYPIVKEEYNGKKITVTMTRADFNSFIETKKKENFIRFKDEVPSLVDQ